MTGVANTGEPFRLTSHEYKPVYAGTKGDVVAVKWSGSAWPGSRCWLA